MKRSVGANQAFTLIELLIVVTIISILASIAVPNFTEAQVRAKVARTETDMRTLCMGVEMYMVDSNTYPPRNTPDQVLPALATQKRDMSHITTPIEYLSSLPADIFAKEYEPPNNGIDYYDSRQCQQYLEPRYSGRAGRWTTAPNVGYLIVSVGPDVAIGAPTNKYLDYPYQGDAIRTLYIVYDPTNGSVSRGNLFRFMGQKPPMQILFPE